MSLSRTGLNWISVTAFCGLLLLTSLAPKESWSDNLRQLLQGKDKILHALAYGVLAVLACRALAGRGRVALAYVVVGMLLRRQGRFLLGISVPVIGRSAVAEVRAEHMQPA